MHNVRTRMTLGSTLWELPPLDGAWESDGRRVKTRILGPNVERGLNRRNKRGSRREKRLNMPGIRLTEASYSVFAIPFPHQNSHQSCQQTVFISQVRRKHITNLCHCHSPLQSQTRWRGFQSENQASCQGWQRHSCPSSPA